MRSKSAVAQDSLEQVVEVVGNTTGQLADGFHLLGLPELRLQHMRAVRFHVPASPPRS